jgi:hypothetical protein
VSLNNNTNPQQNVNNTDAIFFPQPERALVCFQIPWLRPLFLLTKVIYEDDELGGRTIRDRKLKNLEKLI